MDEKKHPNSRVVTIYQSSSFINKAQNIDVKEFITSAIKEIGSYFERGGSTKIASGLSIIEEKLLLPEHLGVSETDKEYFKERNKFYSNFATKIPFIGLRLEIGLTNDNDAPLSYNKSDSSKSNLPINLMDYLRYRHAANHPWVAISEKAGKGNQLKKFYIDDPVVSTQGKADLIAEQDKALTIYLQVKNNPEKVDMMLTLLGLDPRDIIGQTAEQTTSMRMEKLRSFVNTQAVVFQQVFEDRNFEIKYTIRTMVNTGIITKVGSKLLITETGETLGNEDETIEFFKDEKSNSDKIAVLKARVQEALKTKKKVKKIQEVK